MDISLTVATIVLLVLYSALDEIDPLADDLVAGKLTAALVDLFTYVENLSWIVV